jgi:hypothetical protein
MEPDKINQLSREDFLKKGQEVLKKLGQKNQAEKLKPQAPQKPNSGGCLLFFLVIIILSITINQI